MNRPAFNIDGYLGILEAARSSGYRLIPMRACEARRQEPAMILRHDVDVSLDLALQLARVEAEHGVSSTYFILLYNEFYNPLSPKGRRKVRELAELGHEIGLHWDSSLYPSDPEDLGVAFRRDLDILADVAGHEIVSASQHVPIDNPLLDVRRFVKYEAYNEPVSGRYTYVSDSSMQWREFTPVDLIAQRRDLHFLSHPVWWVSAGESLEEKLGNLAREMQTAADREMAEYVEYTLHCLARRKELDRNLAARKRKLADGGAQP